MVLEEFLELWNNDSNTMVVHTSGSTGKPKQLHLLKEDMRESAKNTCRFLQLKPNDEALLCLSLNHIGGMMMVVRAVECNLKLKVVEPSARPLQHLTQAPEFAAMVPMQVYESLKVPKEAELLRNIKHLIIGGSAIDEKLSRVLASFPHAVWSTYGMTETCSHIALRRLNGENASEWYVPFSHINVSLSDKGSLVISKKTLGVDDKDGATMQQWITYDSVIFHEDERRFKVIGRLDNVIVSGGIKIQVEEVERLLAQHLNCLFMISGEPDEKFGQKVVLTIENGDVKQAQYICNKVLPDYWKPKVIRNVNQLPRTKNGKIKRK